ncbi:hypothetical protein EBT16_06400, partial [bacterium]|nr:hypothetical protein [bacterium]
FFLSFFLSFFACVKANGGNPAIGFFFVFVFLDKCIRLAIGCGISPSHKKYAFWLGRKTHLGIDSNNCTQWFLP